jgi:hypothetical protein
MGSDRHHHPPDEIPGLGNVQGITSPRRSDPRFYEPEDEPVIFAVLLTLIAITLWVFL